MTRSPSKGRGYPTPSMARVEKPYRVYKGGRVKGKVPLERPQRAPRRDGRPPQQPRVARPRRRWSWKKRISVGLLVLIVFALLWGVIGFLQFRHGVNAANSRLDKTAPGVRAALAHQNGLLLSKPTTILLLGSDHVNDDQRATLNHSDSIMLLHTTRATIGLRTSRSPATCGSRYPGTGSRRSTRRCRSAGPPSP